MAAVATVVKAKMVMMEAAIGKLETVPLDLFNPLIRLISLLAIQSESLLPCSISLILRMLFNIYLSIFTL